MTAPDRLPDGTASRPEDTSDVQNVTGVTDESADGVVAQAPADGEAAGTRVSLAAKPLIGVVKAYQYVAAGRPSPCRHVPSCSTYAVEALQIHGAVRGSWLAAKRLARCHPWGTQGYDPVPDRKAA